MAPLHYNQHCNKDFTYLHKWPKLPSSDQKLTVWSPDGATGKWKLEPEHAISYRADAASQMSLFPRKLFHAHPVKCFIQLASKPFSFDNINILQDIV